jgi:hypothetical protein
VPTCRKDLGIGNPSGDKRYLARPRHGRGRHEQAISTVDDSELGVPRDAGVDDAQCYPEVGEAKQHPHIFADSASHAPEPKRGMKPFSHDMGNLLRFGLHARLGRCQLLVRGAG